MALDIDNETHRYLYCSQSLLSFAGESEINPSFLGKNIKSLAAKQCLMNHRLVMNQLVKGKLNIC